MNSSVISWISQQSPLELYPNIQYRQPTTGIMESSMLNEYDEDLTQAFGREDINVQNYMSQLYSSTHDVINAPAVMENYTNFSTMTTQPHHSNPCEIVVPQVIREDGEGMSTRVQPEKKKRTRPPWQTYDHIVAERRRREQLSQLFVALSATVPGLKKMDKSSILEEAIKHVKALEEKVKILEEKMEKKGMECVVIVKKSEVVENNEGSFLNDENSSFQMHSLPEIEARKCDNQILVKVHCELHKDALATLICTIEGLDMSIVSTSATPFGDVALDITIVAEMEKECNVSVKEVATALRAALIKS